MRGANVFDAQCTGSRKFVFSRSRDLSTLCGKKFSTLRVNFAFFQNFWVLNFSPYSVPEVENSYFQGHVTSVHCAVKSLAPQNFENFKKKPREM